MRTSVFKIRKPFNKDEIRKSISKIGTFKTDNGGSLVTTFNGRQICESQISDRYFDFDFNKFSIDVLDEIENYFTPETYTLKISSGFQELRLVGEEITIGGEVYYKMFNLLNSTNREYALQMNIGLIRRATGAGVILDTTENGAGMVSRHFFRALPERVKNFVEKLKKFDVIIDAQSVLIEDLAKEIISFSEVINQFMTATDPKTGKVSNSAKNRAKAFGKKLLNSPTDKAKNLNKSQINLLSDPTATLNKKVDVQITGVQALNAYTDVYKNYNSCVQKAEAERILKAMGK